MKQFYQTLDGKIRNNAWLVELDEENFSLKTRYGDYRDVKLYNRGRTTEKKFESLVKAQKAFDKKCATLVKKGLQLSDWDVPLAQFNLIKTAADEKLTKLSIAISSSKGLELIADLAQLEKLSLSVEGYNKSVSIPPCLFDKLGQLKDLSLSSLTDIPESLAKCQQLEKLYISGEVPLFIGDLKSLKSLHISSAQTTLPATIGSLKQLKKLEISNNSLTQLPSSITKLEQLESFIYNYSSLTELPDSFGDLQQLKTIEMKNAKLQTLPDSFSQLQNLSSASFYGCKFEEFPKPLTQLKQLSKLDVSNNKIKTLPDSIKNMAGLVDLNLYYNPLTAGLPDAFFELENLEILDLNYTQLEEIPKAIGQLKKLRALNARGCKAANIPENILGAGKDAIFDYLGLKEDNSETLESTLNQEEIDKILMEKRAAIIKFQEKATRSYGSNLNLERVVNFISYRSNKIPVFEKENYWRFHQITNLLSPIENWTDFDHRLMTLMTGGSWDFVFKGRYDSEPTRRGFYKAFFNWVNDTYKDKDLDIQLLMTNLAKFEIKKEAVVEYAFILLFNLFYDKNYQAKNLGKFLVEEFKANPEKITQNLIQQNRRTNFSLLLVYNYKELRNKYIPRLVLNKENPENIHPNYKILEVLCQTDPAFAGPIVQEAIDKTNAKNSMANLAILSKQYFPEEKERNRVLIKQAYEIIGQMKLSFTNHFEYGGKERSRHKFLDYSLVLYGLEIKDLLPTYIQKAKSATYLIHHHCEIIAKRLGQDGVAAIAVALEAAETKPGHKYFVKLFNILEPFDISSHYDKVWALTKHEDAQIQNLAAQILCKNKVQGLEERANELLKDKNKTLRMGAVYLLHHLGTASATVSLKAIMDKEKAEEVRSVILQFLLDPAAAIDKKEALRRVAATRARGKLKNPVTKWLIEDSLPKLYWTDGKKLDTDTIRFLFYKQKNNKQLTLDIETAPIYELIDKEKSVFFAKELLTLVQKNGDFYAKNRFAFVPMLVLGDDSLITPIKRFCYQKDNATAPTLIGMLGSMGAARALSEIMAKYKTKYPNVREAASNAFDDICDKLNTTRTELMDAMIPDFGFKGLFYHFEVGGDGYHAFVTTNGALNYVDKANGKIRKSVPAKAEKEVKDHLKSVGKEIKAILRQQKKSLESYMIFQRRWEVAQWRKHFMEKPVPFALAQCLVWGIYDTENKLLNSFSVLEDQELEDIEYEAVELAEGQQIGLVHRLDMDEETVEQWKGNLVDGEIEQPFDQFNRPIHKPTEGEKEMKFIHDYDNLKMSSFRGKAERAGWRRGSVVDGGAVASYFKEFPQSGVDVFIEIEGMSVSSWDDYDDITIQNSYFVKHGSLKTGSYYYDEPTKEDDERLLSVGQVSPVIYSEVVKDLRHFTVSK